LNPRPARREDACKRLRCPGGAHPAWNSILWWPYHAAQGV